MDWAKLKIKAAGIISPWRWNSIVDACQSNRIVSVVGGSLVRSSGGTTIFVRRSAGEPGDASHPFKFIVRPKSGSPGFFEGKVVLKSSLYLSLRPNDKQAITGLDDWFDVIGNDAIWLGVIFDGFGSVVSAQIDSWGQGDDFNISESAWSGNNGYCEDDGDTENPVHQTSRKLIAYTIADDDGVPIPTQAMFRDQVLRNMNIDGRPARYMFDHEGGYPF